MDHFNFIGRHGPWTVWKFPNFDYHDDNHVDNIFDDHGNHDHDDYYDNIVTDEFAEHAYGFVVDTQLDEYAGNGGCLDYVDHDGVYDYYRKNGRFHEEGGGGHKPDGGLLLR